MQLDQPCCLAATFSCLLSHHSRFPWALPLLCPAGKGKHALSLSHGFTICFHVFISFFPFSLNIFCFIHLDLTHSLSGPITWYFIVLIYFTNGISCQLHFPIGFYWYIKNELALCVFLILVYPGDFIRYQRFRNLYTISVHEIPIFQQWAPTYIPYVRFTNQVFELGFT